MMMNKMQSLQQSCKNPFESLIPFYCTRGRRQPFNDGDTSSDAVETLNLWTVQVTVVLSDDLRSNLSLWAWKLMRQWAVHNNGFQNGVSCSGVLFSLCLYCVLSLVPINPTFINSVFTRCGSIAATLPWPMFLFSKTPKTYMEGSYWFALLRS